MYDHYLRPLASLAVLADQDARWRPSSYAYQMLGCEMCLTFPVAKLQDYAGRLPELLAHANPFALVTAAHLLTQQTRHHPHRRRIAKWRLTKILYARQRGRERMISFFKVIDWMMRLPDGLQARYMRGAIALQRRESMTYLTSLERHAIGKGLRRGRRQGRQEGRQEGGAEVLAAMLVKRFGPLDGAVAQRLAAANVKQLSAWALNAVEAESLAEVFGD